MFTLKIRQHHWREDNGGPSYHISDGTWFVEAVQLSYHDTFDATTEHPDPALHLWRPEDVDDLRSTTCSVTDPGKVKGQIDMETLYHASRLFGVTRVDGSQHWYLASNAWLLGPGGQTIENLSV